MSIFVSRSYAIGSRVRSWLSIWFHDVRSKIWQHIDISFDKETNVLTFLFCLWSSGLITPSRIRCRQRKLGSKKMTCYWDRQSWKVHTARVVNSAGKELARRSVTAPKVKFSIEGLRFNTDYIVLVDSTSTVISLQSMSTSFLVYDLII